MKTPFTVVDFKRNAPNKSTVALRATKIRAMGTTSEMVLQRTTFSMPRLRRLRHFGANECEYLGAQNDETIYFAIKIQGGVEWSAYLPVRVFFGKSALLGVVTAPGWHLHLWRLFFDPYRQVDRNLAKRPRATRVFVSFFGPFILNKTT